ncbi:hypothetical protein FD04_GL000003 [Secundilactobacillus odoratitofui DSM 19909 = JCM 15043]|uniref:Uncharacterized protein n=1 Tax=Secundilactobacillus odoratitofui DSM 19909 = JCM 15043 TaxID=1423776 RepID=A0A0R1M4P1_9LACO|nr:hypothetical protein FD04_GL000003 [Secundilactobacillus odoratitofui DSM 19909 = JCM 15043]
MKARASLTDLFIFQLPAINGIRTVNAPFVQQFEVTGSFYRIENVLSSILGLIATVKNGLIA